MLDFGAQWSTWSCRTRLELQLLCSLAATGECASGVVGICDWSCVCGDKRVGVVGICLENLLGAV